MVMVHKPRAQRKVNVKADLSWLTIFLSSWIVMLVLGTWHAWYAAVPAPGYGLTIGSLVALGVVGRALFRGHKEDA